MRIDSSYRFDSEGDNQRARVCEDKTTVSLSISLGENWGVKRKKKIETLGQVGACAALIFW